MKGFADLPVEIVIEVLRHVGPGDLLTLCSISELAAVVRPLVCVVCADDEAYERLQSFPDRVWLPDFVDYGILGVENMDIFDYAFVVVDTFGPPVFLEGLAPLLETSLTMSVILNGEDNEHMDVHEFSMLKHYRHVEFSHLTYLLLENVDLNPDVLAFPNLAQIELTSCEVSSDTRTLLRFPSLTEMAVGYSFATISEHIDYENTPLIKLTLWELKELASWHDVLCPTLEYLEFTDYSSAGNIITSLENICLENLASFVVYGVIFENLKNVHFGKLSFLQVGEAFRGFDERYDLDISIENLDCPALTTLELNSSTTLSLSDITLPSVEHVILWSHNRELTSEAVKSLDLEFLRDLKTLRLRNASEVISYAPSLVDLDISGPPPTMSLTLPNLEKLGVDSFEDLNNSSLMGLSHIITLRLLESANSDDIHQINSWYPNLREVGVQSAQWTHVHDLKMKNLETLFISLEGIGPVSFHDCEFDNLTEFQVGGELNFSLEKLGIVAPLLSYLSLLNITADELVLTNFPKLIALFLNGPVKRILFENSTGYLESVKLQNNSVLRSIESNAKFTKLRVVHGSGVPFSDAIISLAPGSWIQGVSPEKGRDLWDWKLYN